MTVSKPIVGIIMGSDSDAKVMNEAARALEQFGVPYEMRVVSAHRTPVEMADYAQTASQRGLRVIIAGAGGAAHLPGMIAAHTTVPVIGVPIPHGPLQGQDALLSIVQMPKGVPVATVAIGNGFNAGLLSAQILAHGGSSGDTHLTRKLQDHRAEMRDQSRAKTVCFAP